MNRLVIFAVVVLVGGAALAAGGDPTKEPLRLWWSTDPHILPVGTLLINFALLVTIIVLLVRKTFVRMLRNRADRFQALIDAAKIAEEKAAARQAELEARLANLDAELQSVRDRFTAQLEVEEEAIRRRTAKEIDRLKQSASAQLEQEASTASSQLRHETAALALQLAQSRVQEAANADDHDRLTAGFVRDLEASQ
ncbi:MAG: hypothetical protein CMH55_00070 [Myxococcales bacterium]|nr:hypothetical protein [Myxococcales bacterium]